MTDLTALDAANRALQASPTVARATKDYGFAAVNAATFAGTLTLEGCTMNGQPVTAAMVRGVPAGQLHIT